MVDTQVDTALSKTGPFTLSIVTDADVINQTLADFSVIVSAKNLLFISVKTNESRGTSLHSVAVFFNCSMMSTAFSMFNISANRGIL